MNIRKIIKQFSILFIFGFVFSFVFLHIIIGAPLSDPNDILIVDEPRANSALTGMANLRFKLYDDDNPTPFYDVGLFSTDCVTKVATIISNDHSIKTNDNIYTKNWNTDGPFLDAITVSDGQYCLKVCVDFSNSGSNYSVCDMRYVTLAEDMNHSPIIVSTISNTNYLVGQSFRYDVNATDADGDLLRYELVNAPSFLTIDSATGEIVSTHELNESGSFSAIVRVSDLKGGVASQQFSFVVNEDTNQQVPSIIIISPRGDALYSNDLENMIVWHIENIDDISKINIYYSIDGINWVLIKSFDNENVNEYRWELDDEIKSGDYFIKVEVIDKDNKSYTSISDKFSITNTKNQNIEYTANITDVIPLEDSDIDKLEQIKAKLVVSKDDAEVNKDSIKVTIDDKDISKFCELLADNMLACDVSSEQFDNGKHKIEISFNDTNNISASKMWHFNLQNKIEETTNSNATTHTSPLWAIIALICIILAILILVPWFLYLLWKRKDEGYDEYENEEGYNNDEYYNTESDLNDYYLEPEAQEQNIEINQKSESSDSSKYFPEEEDDDDFVGEASLADALNSKESQKKEKPKEAKDFNLDQNDDGLLDENDIPDWLKNNGNSSTPLTPTGDKIKTTRKDKNNGNSSNGTEPFDDYGLATKD